MHALACIAAPGIVPYAWNPLTCRRALQDLQYPDAFGVLPQLLPALAPSLRRLTLAGCCTDWPYLWVDSCALLASPLCCPPLPLPAACRLLHPATFWPCTAGEPGNARCAAVHGRAAAAALPYRAAHRQVCCSGQRTEGRRRTGRRPAAPATSTDALYSALACPLSIFPLPSGCCTRCTTMPVRSAALMSPHCTFRRYRHMTLCHVCIVCAGWARGTRMERAGMSCRRPSPSSQRCAA